MKIAIVATSLPGKEGGGVSYQAHGLANKLVERGHSVTVFSFSDKPDDAKYNLVKMKVPEAFSSGCFRKLLRGYLSPFYVAFQDLAGFDVVHAHGDDQFLFRCKIPHVRTFYGSAFSEAVHAGSWKRRIGQLVLYPFEFLSGLVADKAIAISNNTRRDLPFIREVIPGGVDLERFRPSGAKSDNPSVLFVGTFHGRKRGKLLLEVFRSQVKPLLPDAELWMVCDKEIKADGVRWWRLGTLPVDELVRLYQGAWAFCLPSSYEGFGVPYIEAMACGTPVVATPNAGAREVLEDGEYGLIVEDKKLGEAIVCLLKDDDLRWGLSQKGLDYVQKFSWENIVREYEKVYLQFVEIRKQKGKAEAGKL